MSETTRIDAIKVIDRHRKDFGDIDLLAASIADIGLLQPVVVTADLRLVAGERRLRAARSLGWTTVPTRIVSSLTDAVSVLKAERDENTCRKAMTPEELVTVGLEIERLERPRAKERQAHGLTAPGRPLNARGPLGPSDAPSRTNEVVADALGTSTNTYKRAKHVVLVAKGEIEAPPEVKAVAEEQLDRMNSGETPITTAYNRVREARSPQAEKPRPAPDSRLTRPQPPKYGGNRKKHAQILESVAISLQGLAMVADEITELDASVTDEEAVRLADDLSKSIRSLNRIKQNLYRKATP